MEHDVDEFDQDSETGEPIGELGAFLVDPSPELTGRVARSINRHTLASDSVDFSVLIMLQTFWEFLKGVFEVIPVKIDDETEEDRDER